MSWINFFGLNCNFSHLEKSISHVSTITLYFKLAFPSSTSRNVLNKTSKKNSQCQPLSHYASNYFVVSLNTYDKHKYMFCEQSCDVFFLDIKRWPLMKTYLKFVYTVGYCFITCLVLWAGEIKQIVRCDLLSEPARWSYIYMYLAHSGLLPYFVRKNSLRNKW